MLQRAAASAAKSIEEVPDSPGMELEISGQSRGLVRKLEEEPQGGPSTTKRRIEAAIAQAVARNQQLDLGNRRPPAADERMSDQNEDLMTIDWEKELEEDIYFIQAAGKGAEEDDYFTKKRGGDEVLERSITKEEWPEWNKSDATEWDGVLSTG
eukprot:8571353-Pyramimonas_sp.AAC.1